MRNVIQWLFISIFVLSTLCFGPVVMAGSSDFSGRIPLAPGHQQATDISLNGQNLTPDELTALSLKQDISQLNPNPSDVWQDKMILKARGQSLDPNLSTLNLSVPTTFQYVEDSPSVVATYRILVRTSDNSNFYLVMDKGNHNYMLRRALLEKMGYILQPFQYMPTATLKFSGNFQKNIFIDSLKSHLLTTHPEAWVTNLSDLESSVAQLQDVVMLPANFDTQDLADIIPGGFAQGRRVFNSLVIPYTLANSPESVNSFSWEAGEIYNEQLFLSCPLEEGFTASLEDAKWMLRRLNQLDRVDFQEVVASAYFPPEVANVMVEKLIGRRHSMNVLFNQGEGQVSKRLKTPVYPIADTRVQANMKIGQVDEKHVFPGYATHFVGELPDNPISSSQIFAFVRSRFYGSTLKIITLIRFNNWRHNS